MVKPVVRVVHIKLGADAQVVEVPDSLRAMQGLVGGMLERVRLPGGLDLWCNEEALMHGDPVINFVLMTPVGPLPIFGDCFVARHTDDGETASVTEKDIKLFTRMFEGRSEHTAAHRSDAS